MTKEEFSDAVLARLDITSDDVDVRYIHCLLDDGFSLEDAVKYVRCWEEVTPELEESIALGRMKEIGSKYPKYQARRKTTS